MFNFAEKKELSLVKKIYNYTNPQVRHKIFYGGYKDAYEILKNLNEIIKKENWYTLEERYDICKEVYFQVWIRKHHIEVFGGFASTRDIKEMLCKKFEFLNTNILLEMIDESIRVIYEKEPDIQKMDAAMEYRQSMHLQFAEMNKNIELKYINDDDYGLVPTKPVFVNGFGSDKKFLGNLSTETGKEITCRRVCSMNIEGINGPVDMYTILTTNNENCGELFVCNYGTTMPTVAPKGYMFRSK